MDIYIYIYIYIGVGVTVWEQRTAQPKAVAPKGPKSLVGCRSQPIRTPCSRGGRNGWDQRTALLKAVAPKGPKSIGKQLRGGASGGCRQKAPGVGGVASLGRALGIWRVSPERTSSPPASWVYPKRSCTSQRQHIIPGCSLHSDASNTDADACSCITVPGRRHSNGYSYCGRPDREAPAVPNRESTFFEDPSCTKCNK